MANNRTGYLYVVISASGFGVLPIMMKHAYALGLSPLQVQSLRYVIAAATCWLVALVVARKDFRHFSRRFIYFLIGTEVAYIAAEATYAYALARMDASLVASLYYTYPVFIAVFSLIFLKERFSKWRFGALGMVLLGCALIVGIDPSKGFDADATGVLLVMAAAVLVALGTTFLVKLTDEKPTVVVTTLGLSIDALAFAIMAPPFFVTQVGAIGEMALIGLILGVVGTSAPVIMFIAGMRLIGPSNAAIAAATELIVALVAAYLYLSERMTGLQMVGAIIIIAAVTLVQWQPDPAKKLGEVIE